MKTLFRNLVLLSILSFSLGVSGQDSVSMKTMPFQFSLVTPIGTNGLESWNTINNVSINIYGGYAGGLDGFEVSGFFNLLKSDMKGAQFAGFVNADLGVTQGAQFAGFVNYNHKALKGAQFAGFVNTVNGDVEAAQAAGFVNVAVGKLKGAQFSGFANVITKDAVSGQFSGFVNTTVGNMDGFQASGFANYSHGNQMGQISGFVNMNTGSLKGLQASGFANINTGEVDGAQLSGFVNVTNRLKGVQLGVFNYVDSLESGLPIGLLSIVRNGYRSFEIGTSESLYGTASFKIGTEQFYNIFSAGLAVNNDKLLWAYGYGIGTQIPMSTKICLNIEALTYQVNEDEWQTKRLNLLNKFQVLASWQVAEHITLVGGPSFNVVVSDLNDNGIRLENSAIAPYSVWKKTYSNGNQVVLYPGFTLGVRF